MTRQGWNAQPNRNRRARQGWSRSALRGLQVAGTSLALLSLGGGLLLKMGGGAAAEVPAGERPEFTMLVAGRDVAYCGYHLRCEDQTQREGLFQPINTDTLMVVKVSGAEVDILNIPRDTNVGEFNPEIPLAQQKINSQYAQGGPYALTRAAEQVTGSPIDAYVIVNEDYVAQLIDAVGGLTVTVPEGGIQWQDQAAGIDLDLPPGEQHLDGRTAALYLRVRKGVGDDWGRIDHQKQALTQLLNKLRSPQGLRVLPTLLAGFGKDIETDLDPARLAALVPYLSDINPSFATLPTTSIPGNFNLAVDQAALSRIWDNAALEAYRTQEQQEQAALEAEATADGAEMPDEPSADASNLPSPLDTPVRIVDASDAALGPALQRALERAGYTAVTTELHGADPAASQVLTLSAPAAASELAATLDLPRLQGERFDVAQGEVVVLLGADAPERFAALRALRRPGDLRLLAPQRGAASGLALP